MPDIARCFACKGERAQRHLITQVLLLLGAAPAPSCPSIQVFSSFETTGSRPNNSNS